MLLSNKGFYVNGTAYLTEQSTSALPVGDELTGFRINGKNVKVLLKQGTDSPRYPWGSVARTVSAQSNGFRRNGNSLVIADDSSCPLPANANGSTVTFLASGGTLPRPDNDSTAWRVFKNETVNIIAETDNKWYLSDKTGTKYNGRIVLLDIQAAGGTGGKSTDHGNDQSGGGGGGGGCYAMIAIDLATVGVDLFTQKRRIELKYDNGSWSVWWRDKDANTYAQIIVKKGDNGSDGDPGGWQVGGGAGGGFASPPHEHPEGSRVYGARILGFVKGAAGGPGGSDEEGNPGGGANTYHVIPFGQGQSNWSYSSPAGIRGGDEGLNGDKTSYQIAGGGGGASFWGSGGHGGNYVWEASSSYDNARGGNAGVPNNPGRYNPTNSSNNAYSTAYGGGSGGGGIWEDDQWIGTSLDDQSGGIRGNSFCRVWTSYPDTI